MYRIYHIEKITDKQAHSETVLDETGTIKPTWSEAAHQCRTKIQDRKEIHMWFRLELKREVCSSKACLHL